MHVKELVAVWPVSTQNLGGGKNARGDKSSKYPQKCHNVKEKEEEGAAGE